MSLAKLPTPLKWRSQTHQNSLASLIGSILLQRSDPLTLLHARSHLLPSPLPSSLFARILTRIHSQPEPALLFFFFARSHLNFQPNLASISKLALALLQSPKLHSQTKQILEPILRSNPVHLVLDSMLRANSRPEEALSFLLQSYADLGVFSNSFLVLERIKALGFLPSTGSCNGLLESLCNSRWFELGLACYANLIRHGFVHDSETWCLVCRVLCGLGKFRNAMLVLNWMVAREIETSFDVYASVLDVGCRMRDILLSDVILKEMIVRGYVLVMPFFDYDLVIGRFCELGRTYAGGMLFWRARDVKFELEESTYDGYLRALAREGRTKEAIELYRVIMEEGVAISSSTCGVFLSGMCKGEPSKEVDGVLKDLIEKGFVPNSEDLSMYVGRQCNMGRWNDAGDMLNEVLDKGVMLDAFCCSSLVGHYCENGLVDSAIKLYGKMKKCGGCLDMKSYNVLLEALSSETRVEEAIQVFEHMREKGITSSVSSVIMIKVLCRERELRKAMNIHDEMMKLGLKPDDKTYRQLIASFV